MTIETDPSNNAHGHRENGLMQESHGHWDAKPKAGTGTTSARGDATTTNDDLIDFDGAGDDEDNGAAAQDGAQSDATDGDEDDLTKAAALMKSITNNELEKQRLMRKAYAMSKTAQEPLLRLMPKIVEAFPGLSDFVLANAKTMAPKNKAALTFYVGYVLKARVGKLNGKAN